MTQARQVHTIARRRSALSPSAVFSEVEPLTLSHHLWPTNDYFPAVQVRLYYTGDRLHVRFRTHESDPRITYLQYNEPVYKDSCVEFFVQPAPETDDRYLNFEWNAAGTMLLGLGTGRGGDRSLEGLNPAMFRPTTASGDDYWELGFEVPFAFLRGVFPAFRAEPGDVMRANFYKCGDDTAQPHYLSWNDIPLNPPDFHRPACFGELVFGD